MAGVSYDDAAVAFGCNPQTMRQHYIALDEVEISDRVMEKNTVANRRSSGDLFFLSAGKEKGLTASRRKSLCRKSAEERT